MFAPDPDIIRTPTPEPPVVLHWFIPHPTSCKIRLPFHPFCRWRLVRVRFLCSCGTGSITPPKDWLLTQVAPVESRFTATLLCPGHVHTRSCSLPHHPCGFEQPAGAEQPTGAQQPTGAEEPTGAEQPAVTEQPTVAELPAVTEQPAGAEQPAVPRA